LDQLTFEDTIPEPSAPSFPESAELSSFLESAEPCDTAIPSALCLEEGAEKAYAAPRASSRDVSTAPVIERAHDDTIAQGMLAQVCPTLTVLLYRRGIYFVKRSKAPEPGSSFG
jgi:hypothetical protein